MPTAITPELVGPMGFAVISIFLAVAGLVAKGTLRLGRECDEKDRQLIAAEKRRQEEVAFWQGQASYWQKRAERGTTFAERATTVAETLAGGRE